MEGDGRFRAKRETCERGVTDEGIIRENERVGKEGRIREQHTRMKQREAKGMRTENNDGMIDITKKYGT